MIIVLSLISCSIKINYSGKYFYLSGNCSSKIIDLQKVQGFGNKYYIITIFKDKSHTKKGKEFLGVIEKNRLIVYKGTRLQSKNLKTAGIITIKNKILSISSDGKNCIFKLIE